MTKKLTIEYCKKKSKEKEYILLENIYLNAHTKMNFQHVKCKYIFSMKWNNFNSGDRCPNCQRKSVGFKKRLKIEDCKKIAFNRGFKLLNNIYINNKTKMEFVHIDCGFKFLKGWSNFQSEKGCPKCSGKIKLSIEFCQKESFNRGYQLLSKKYKNNKTKMNFKHIECQSNFLMNWTNFYNGKRGCPTCDSSLGELEIKKYLKIWKIKNYHEYYGFKECRDKKVLPFDFYIKKYNICIEYQGKQHFEPIQYTYSITIEQAKKNLRIQKNHDKIKRKFCKNNNIILLEIRYKDFNNIENILYNKIEEIKNG